MSSDPEDPAPTVEPAPAEALGLRSAHLAARVRQALYHVPAGRARPRRSSGCGKAPSPGTWTTSWMARSRPSASSPAPSRCFPSKSSTSTASYARCTTRWSECRNCTSPIPRSEASSASSRKRTPGSASAGLPPCERAIRSSIGWTRWWTTPARSGRTRSSSSSPTSPASAGCYLVPSVEEVVSEAIVPLILARDPGLRIDRLTDARELLRPRAHRSPGRPSVAPADGSASSSPSTSWRESTSSGGWRSTFAAATAWRRCTRIRASSGCRTARSTYEGLEWTWSTATTACSIWSRSRARE